MYVFHGHFAFSSIQTVDVFIIYISCLHHNILMKFVSKQRGQIVVQNDTKH